MKKHIMMLLIFYTSAINASQALTIKDALALASKLTLVTQPTAERRLARQSRDEFSRPLSTRSAANLVPGQRELIEGIERRVEATFRGAKDFVDETMESAAALRRRTKEGISSTARTASEGLSTAWHTVAMTPEKIRALFTRQYESEATELPEATTDATAEVRPQRTRNSELIALMQQAPRAERRKAITQLKEAEKKLETIKDILSKAKEAAETTAKEIKEEGQKVADEIMQLVPEEEQKIRQQASDAIKKLKREHIASTTAHYDTRRPMLQETGFSSSIAFTRFNRQFTDLLTSEVIPVDDQPYPQNIVGTDPEVTSMNQRFEHIHAQAAQLIEGVHARAEEQANFMKARAELFAAKASAEALHQESQKFITVMEEFYAIVTVDILKEIRSGKAFLRINPIFKEIQAEVKTQLTIAAHCWLEFEAAFNGLPVAVRIKETPYRRTPMQWAKLTADAGFAGAEPNKVFHPMYIEHTELKLQHVEELTDELTANVKAFAEQANATDDEKEFNNIKEINIDLFKNMFEAIYKILFAQTMKSDYFAIKSEFKIIFPEGIRSEQLSELLRTIGIVWQILITHELLKANDIVKLYHPLAQNKKPLELKASKWLDYTVNAKFDAHDADDAEFTATLQGMTQQADPKQAKQPITEQLTEFVRDRLRGRVKTDDDL